MNNLNKKTIIIIVGVIGVVLALATLLTLQSHKSLSLSKVLATNVRYAHLTDKGNVRFFNGSAFMELDTATQKAKRLTPNYALPNVLNVRWSDSGVLFQANSYSGGDQLRKILFSTGASTTSTYWWSVDFKTGSIAPVGSLDYARDQGSIVDDVVWDTSGTSYAYIERPTASDIEPVTTLFKGGLTTAASKIAVVNATQLNFMDSDKILYLSDKELKAIDLRTLRIDAIESAINNTININAKGTRNVFIDGDASGYESLSEASGPLVYRELNSKKVKTIAKKFVGSVAWNRAGDTWAAIDSSKTDAFSGFIGTDDGKVSTVTLKNTDLKNKPENLRIVGYQDGVMVLLDASNNLYRAETRLPKFDKQFDGTNGNLSFGGTSELLERGLGDAQLKGFEFSMGQYIIGKNIQAKTVTVSAVTKVPHDRFSASRADSMSFDVKIDDTDTMTGKLDFQNLSVVRLTLTDKKSAAVLYDSGNIDVTAR